MRSARSRPNDLRELARCWGVATSYRDGLGRRRQVPKDSLVAILQSLGAPLRGPGDARDALRAWRHDRWNGHTEPVLVAWDGRGPPISLRVPARLDGDHVDGDLVLETGTRRRLSWNLGDLRTSARTNIAGHPFVEKELPIPSPLPYGYHRLRLAMKGHQRRVFVISSPIRSFRPASPERTWGVFLPLYALHSRSSWGAGDLGDLRRLAEWTAGQGGGLVASLPLLAAFLGDPCEPSPYRPVSRLFWNEFYLDVPSAVAAFAGERARQRLQDPAVQESLESLRGSRLVDYPGVIRLKRRILEDLARDILGGSGPSRGGFEAFLRSRPEAAEYARFRDALERKGDSADAGLTGARERTVEEAQETPREYHAVLQWIFESQMRDTATAARRLGVLLYLDLPLGVHPEGFDVARYPDAFVRGMNVGAPPDVLFTSGQEWGFPPLHPERTREAEHEYFRAVLGEHLRFASVLRIDHVMGLHRLFWIPEGGSAERGTYVRYPADELYAILCLESHRHEAILVGENLGTVPASVNRSLQRHGISPIYVLHYHLESGGDPSATGIRGEAVASLNSHDLPPFAAFWAALDIDEREACRLVSHGQAQAMKRERARIRRALEQRIRADGGLRGPVDEAAALRGLLDILARSAAWAVVVNLEDLWSETASQNVPGTSTQVPNWRRKGRLSLEQFASEATVKSLLASVDATRRNGRPARAMGKARANQEGS